MDEIVLALVAGAVLSLAFSYIPGVNTWFAALDGAMKRLLMLALLLAVALAVVGIACSGFGADIGIDVTCDRAGFIGMLKAFVLAMIANQGTYPITPKTQSVKSILSK